MILAGDIGGTNARLALFPPDGKGRPWKHDTFESRSYKSLESVVRAFLGDTPPSIEAATFGVAGPVIDQRVVATNFPWVVDGRLAARRLGIPKLTLLNDLVALSFGALTVSSRKLRVLQVGAPRKTGGNLAVIAAGTGLGEAALVWDGAKHVPLATEGGHTDLAAQTPLEWELFTWLEKRFGHVSYERVVAGPGFSTLYDFFRDAKGMSERRELTLQLADAPDRNALIAELGASGKSEVAYHAVQLFSRFYGAEAGNLALKTLATAGVFVAGGIAAHLADHLARGPFLEGFLSKGRFRALLEKVPVAVVLDPSVGLAGSAYHAARASAGAAPGRHSPGKAVKKKARPAAKRGR